MAIKVPKVNLAAGLNCLGLQNSMLVKLWYYHIVKICQDGRFGRSFHPKTSFVNKYSFVMLKKILTLLVLFLILGNSYSNASHMVGGDLNYTCVNSCTIQVNLKLYRDCSGSAYLSPNSFDFIDTSAVFGGCTLPVPLGNWPANALVTELTPLCPQFTPTNCTVPTSSFKGVQEYWFSRQYDVCAASPCNFPMWWGTCCRAPSLTNINQPGSESIYLGFISYNNAVPGCNNPPFFNSPPVSYLCVGQSVALDIGATDPEGDSLGYGIGPCFSTSTSSQVSYRGGYTFQQPLGPSWDVSLNPNTGLLTLNAQPGGPEVAAVCIYVYEYRNGQLVNILQRDFMIVVLPCPEGPCDKNLVTGRVYKDDNANCSLDGSESRLQNWKVSVQPGNIIVPTDSDGVYKFYAPPGSFTLTEIPNPSGTWTQTCPSTLSYSVSFTGTNDTVSGLDFGNESIYDCPGMWVDIVSNQARPCFSSMFSVSYGNIGTDTAFNSFVEVELDPEYSFDTSSIPLTASSGNVYTFDVGTVPPGVFGTFTFSADLNCNSLFIQRTYCTEAHIFPDTNCIPLAPNWDLSSLEMSEECIGDSLVCYTISNNGNGSMQGPTDWRLYENAVLQSSGTIQLCAACDTTLCFLSNGNTFRLEVDQRPGHPGYSQPNATLELCGLPFTTTGLVAALPEDDGDFFRSIQCMVATNSYDPNSKYVYPAGVDPAFHYIDESDELEYKIDFQNEGTADAITVQLVDTLSPYLDIQTITPGASSHPYTWELMSDRRLKFTFNNINLPPLSQDSLGSIGFVKFKIKQMPGNQMGTRIENTADIFFDFNPAIRTNTVFNTIGWPVVIGLGPESRAIEVKIFPNPSTGEFFAEVTGMEAGHRLSFEVYSLVGQRVLMGNFETGQRYRADLGAYPAGVYIYRILDGERLVKAGKLLLE